MSVETKIVDASTSGLTRTFTIELGSRRIEAIMTTRLERLGHTAQIKGFRTGRAPLSVLRRRFAARMTPNVVDRLAVEVAREIITDRQLRPASRPVIDALTKLPGGEFRFRLIIEVFPEVSLEPPEGLSVQRLVATPSEMRLSHVQSELQDHDQAPSPQRLAAEELARLSRLYLKRQVLDWLAARYDFEVPRTMVEKELRRILKHHFEHIGGNVDDRLEERYREIAQRRIRLAIILLKIGKAYNVQVSATDIGLLVRSDDADGEQHNATLVDFYLQHPTALAELQSPRLEDSVVDAILDRSEVSVRTVSADQLVEAAGMDSLGLP